MNADFLFMIYNEKILKPFQWINDLIQLQLRLCRLDYNKKIEIYIVIFTQSHHLWKYMAL